jgi:hypothetical protein
VVDRENHLLEEEEEVEEEEEWEEGEVEEGLLHCWVFESDSLSCKNYLN